MVSKKSYTQGLHFRHGFGSKEPKTQKRQNIFLEGGQKDQKSPKYFPRLEIQDQKRKNTLQKK